MRWTPVVADAVIVFVVWSAAMMLLRHARRRLAVGASEGERRGYRLQAAGTICAASGLTFFIVWLLSDSRGPRWLHTVAEPAALVAIALAAGLSGYSAWVRAR